MPGGPTAPMTDYALCGAILESPKGDGYVKITGPEAVVKAATEAFRKMVLESGKTGTRTEPK